jgi:hypothetical protein
MNKHLENVWGGFGCRNCRVEDDPCEGVLNNEPLRKMGFANLLDEFWLKIKDR